MTSFSFVTTALSIRFCKTEQIYIITNNKLSTSMTHIHHLFYINVQTHRNMHLMFNNHSDFFLTSKSKIRLNTENPLNKIFVAEPPGQRYNSIII